MPAQIAMLDGMGKRRRSRRRRRSRALNGPVSIGVLGADGGGMGMMPWLIGGVVVAGAAVWWFKFRKSGGGAPALVQSAYVPAQTRSNSLMYG